jgi:hypothetical protein
MDPRIRIRIHPKMSWIRNTENNTFHPLIACAQYFATLSLGLRGASLTSTAYDRITEADAAILDEDIVKYRMVKKKGYVRLTTSLGLLFERFLCGQTFSIEILFHSSIGCTLLIHKQNHTIVSTTYYYRI